ncbi:hypothetical protein ESA94_13400 [Lacibacter luteus]|uniref:Uncharacterized protein n=1 Tax=Lacibacter luteus TaxID=2508719 RepID=A0A4Q1CI40_9BACT|nr:hypothetical protein [Lacibacter luteus]RXK60037.1 hypothetical protein ESA94_13400 [Lacibacter luteus]
MAIKNVQIELFESNLFVELEAEETMTFTILIAKLKAAEHLQPEKVYYIKTATGASVKESNSFNFYKQSYFVITENPDWKTQETTGPGLNDVPVVTTDLMMNDDKYWVLPFLTGVSWKNDELQSQLFCLDKIETSSGRTMSVNIVVQYSPLDTPPSSRKHIYDRTLKMKEILADALGVELVMNNITEMNFQDHAAKLSEKILYYLTSHMELKWGTKISFVAIVGFRELV